MLASLDKTRRLLIARVVGKVTPIRRSRVEERMSVIVSHGPCSSAYSFSVYFPYKCLFTNESAHISLCFHWRATADEDGHYSLAIPL